MLLVRRCGAGGGPATLRGRWVVAVSASARRPRGRAPRLLCGVRSAVVARRVARCLVDRTAGGIGSGRGWPLGRGLVARGRRWRRPGSGRHGSSGWGDGPAPGGRVRGRTDGGLHRSAVGGPVVAVARSGRLDRRRRRHRWWWRKLGRERRGAERGRCRRDEAREWLVVSGDHLGVERLTRRRAGDRCGSDGRERSACADDRDGDRGGDATPVGRRRRRRPALPLVAGRGDLVGGYQQVVTHLVQQLSHPSVLARVQQVVQLVVHHLVSAAGR